MKILIEIELPEKVDHQAFFETFEQHLIETEIEFKLENPIRFQYHELLK